MSSGPAEATHPGPNGRIVFHRGDDSGFDQVWTANPDLTAQHKLTDEKAYSGFATWSPDATHIAFDSNRSDPDPDDGLGVNDVFTMRADGSDVRKLTDSVGFSGDPAYSPDGSLIAFEADRGVTSGHPGWPAAWPNAGIFVINADGLGMRRVTSPPAGSSDMEPRFSPDGTRVLFTRFRGGHFFEADRTPVGDTSALFTIKLDGTALHRVTGWGGKAGQADWSPDGSRLVFEEACCRPGGNGIFTVRADGSGLAALVRGGLTGIGSEQTVQLDGYYDPVWSPDGTKILAGHETYDTEAGYRSGLVVADADGSDLDWVTMDVQHEHQPDWGTAPLE